MKKNMRKMTKNRGFTLVELMVVIVVLAVLASFAVPALTGYIQRAKDSKLIAECTACVASAQAISDMRAESGQKTPVTVLDQSGIFRMADITNADSKLFSLKLDTGTPVVVELLYSGGDPKRGVEYKDGKFEVVSITGFSAQGTASAANVLFQNNSLLHKDPGGGNRLAAIKELYAEMGLTEFQPVDEDVIKTLYPDTWDVDKLKNLRWIAYPIGSSSMSDDVVYFANNKVTTLDSYTGRSDQEQDKYNLIYINGDLYYGPKSTDTLKIAQATVKNGQELINWITTEKKWKKYSPDE